MRYSGLESWEQYSGTGDEILDLVTERGDVLLYHEALLVDLASRDHGSELSVRFRTRLGTLDLVFGGVSDHVLWPTPEMARPPEGSGVGVHPADLEFVSFLALPSTTDGERLDILLGTTLFSVRFSADVLRVDWVDDDVYDFSVGDRALGQVERRAPRVTDGVALVRPQGAGTAVQLSRRGLVDLLVGAVVEQTRLTTSGTLTLSLQADDGALAVSFLGVEKVSVSGGSEVCGPGEVWVPLGGLAQRRLVVERCSWQTEDPEPGESTGVVLDLAPDRVSVLFQFREVWSVGQGDNRALRAE